MIITNKEKCLDYCGINENLDKALRFIHETNFSELEDGLHLIDGQDVRVKIQHMQTKSPEEGKLEAHDEFADIQMVFEGKEQYLLCFRSDAKIIEKKPENDVCFFAGESFPIDLKRNELIIVFPDDVHAPGICVDNPETIRKGVFKVRL